VYEIPKTIRPDLIGKTIVDILDPRPHGEGRIKPMIAIGEIVAAEEGYARMRYTKMADGTPTSGLLDLYLRLEPCYDEYEPGEKLDEYLPGYSAIVGTPDYVLNSYERHRAVMRAHEDEAAELRAGRRH
jgi:hypothetical protein